MPDRLLAVRMDVFNKRRKAEIEPLGIYEL